MKYDLQGVLDVLGFERTDENTWTFKYKNSHCTYDTRTDIITSYSGEHPVLTLTLGQFIDWYGTMIDVGDKKNK